MDLQERASDLWEKIKRQINSEAGPMIFATIGLVLLGVNTGNGIFYGLAIFTAYRLGLIEGEGEVICDECGDSLEEPYEGSRDHTENRVNTIDLLRSKEK